LAENRALVTLKLEGGIGDKGAASLALAMQRPLRLRTLVLKINSIGPRGARSLGHDLAQPLTLTLTLIGGARSLGHGLAQPLTLTLIGGARSLGHGLAQPLCHIKHLVLDGNPLEDEGLFEIADGMSRNSCIERLHLSGAGIGKTGPEALVALLESFALNRTMKRLDISKNRIGAVRKKGVSKSDQAYQDAVVIHRALSNVFTVSDLDFIELYANPVAEDMHSKSLLSGLSVPHLRRACLANVAVQVVLDPPGSVNGIITLS